MTPQEKAKELFDRMYEAIPAHPEGGSIEYDAAKECALIAVDEMIRVSPWGGDDNVQIEDGSKEYYMNVKKEIEKL
jgi:hypothetical protein